MKSDIERALGEAKISVFQIVLVCSFVDSLVVLMLLLLACTLLTLPLWWALVPAVVYLLIHTKGNMSDVNFSKIEEKFPDLKEQLITVADNLTLRNEVIDELNKEVLRKMREIRTGYFVDFGKMTRELVVMAVVSFVIIGSAAFNVEFLDIKDIAKEIQEFKPFEDYDINQELLEYEESQNLSEILGDENIAELGQQQLDLQINPIKSDVDIGQVRDPEERRFKELPPAEIRASSDAAYQEDIPKQYQRIVKTYFKEITRS